MSYSCLCYPVKEGFRRPSSICHLGKQRPEAAAVASFAAWPGLTMQLPTEGTVHFL